jgi:hypothetical protein
MSLINDALKRASQAQRAATPPPPAEAPPLTPAAHARPAQWPMVAVPLLLLGVLVVAVWFFQQALQTSRQRLLAPAQNPVVAREPAAPAHSSPPSPAEAALPPTNPPAPVASLATPVAASSHAALPVATPATNPSVPVAVVPPSPPPLRLKAIFYRPLNPTALINTKSVSVGDRVGDARVIAITRESVSLLQDGQTNVLTIE